MRVRSSAPMRRVCSSRSARPTASPRLARPKSGEHVAQIACEAFEEADDVFRLAAEFRAQLGLLGSDAGGAGIEVTLARHVAADGDEHRGAKGKFIRAEHGGDEDIARGLETAIAAQAHAAAQALRLEAIAAPPRGPAPRGCRRA